MQKATFELNETEIIWLNEATNEKITQLKAELENATNEEDIEFLAIEIQRLERLVMRFEHAIN